jgi:hypothetical protein
VAVNTSREELERLNPELLDKASGAPIDAAEPDSEGSEDDDLIRRRIRF